MTKSEQSTGLGVVGVAEDKVLPPVTIPIAGLVRPIIGIENRTADEVFEIMVNRISRALASAVSAPSMTPTTHTATDVGGLSNEQKEITLLRIIDAMGGRTDSSDYPGNWLTWFCSDEIHNVQEDTFNRCNDKGWLHTTHDTSFDISTTTLTAAGRAALTTLGGSDANS